MTDILFTHCNYLYSDSRQMQKMQPYPPLQTITAAAYLRERGFDVGLFDSTLNSPDPGFRETVIRCRPKLIVVCEDSFNFVAKMCLKRNRETAFAMARIAREFGIPIVVGSPDASSCAQEYLASGFDFVLIGEVENTLVEIAELFMGVVPHEISQIAGLAYLKESGMTHYTSPRELEEDLDHFTPAAWDLVDVEAYRRAWIRAHGIFCLNMVSSRGCPYSCNWCAKPVFGQSYRSMSGKRAAHEMQYLKEVYGPDQIWVADDIFALTPQWALQFAEEINRLDAHIPFRIQSRCDLITEDTAAALRRAGCIEVWLGVESGSQRILDAMGKGTGVEQAYAARSLLKSHGIRACYFLQFGYPGERWEDIQSTIQLVRETVPDDVGISVSYPLPGTKFYDRVAAEMSAGSNWSESGDLSVMFHATYNSKFYAELHDALHHEVEMLNGKTTKCFTTPHLYKLRAQASV